MKIATNREELLQSVREAYVATGMSEALLCKTVSRALGRPRPESAKKVGNLSTIDLGELLGVLLDWPAYRCRWIAQMLELPPASWPEEFSGAARRELNGFADVTMADMPAIEAAFAKDLGAL